MSKVRFLCPHCGGKLSAPETLAGKIVPCLHCNADTFIPAPPSAQPDSSGQPVTPAEIVSVELKFACPKCYARLQVEIQAAGHRITCPHCKAPMDIPRLPPCPMPLVEAAAQAPAKGADFAEVAPFPLTRDEINFLTSADEPVSGSAPAGSGPAAAANEP